MLDYIDGARVSLAGRLSATFRARVGTRGAGAIGLAILAAAGLFAHEGHDTAKPVYKQVQAGDATYRIGFAFQPLAPLVGEDIGIEFQILQLSDPLANPGVGKPVPSADLQARITSSGKEPRALSEIGVGEKPGTYTAHYEFVDSGRYVISARVASWPDRISAEFPIVVGPGPVLRAAVAIDGIVLLILGGLAFARWRGRGEQAGVNGGDAALVVAGLAGLLVAHMFVSPHVGRLFLPERHLGPVPWDPGVPPSEAPTPAPHIDPPGTPPHSHGDKPGAKPPPHTHPAGTPPHEHKEDAGVSPVSTAAPRQAQDIVATVVNVPGHLVDVVVPMSARVLFGDFTPRVGRSVRRGQTIAMLEHHYVMHDAVHLINQRWLYLVRMLDSKRVSLDTAMKAVRLHHLEKTGDASVRQAMSVTQEVQAADTTAIAARLEHQQAVKLLAMHDAQIAESELVRRPLVSPIDGTIEAMNFTQGQLKYENDKLFTILDLSRVWVEVRFPEQFASRPPPRELSFVSPAFPERRFTGKLARVANTLDAATGTLSAFFEVPNPERALRVGMQRRASAVSNLRTGGRGCGNWRRPQDGRKSSGGRPQSSRYDTCSHGEGQAGDDRRSHGADLGAD